VDGGPLREGRRSAGGQDGGEATGCTATAPDADSFRSLRRVMRAMIPPVIIVCRSACSVAHLRRPRRRFSKQGLYGRSVQPSALGRDASREYTDLRQTPALSGVDGALAEFLRKVTVGGGLAPHWQSTAIFRANSVIVGFFRK